MRVAEADASCGIPATAIGSSVSMVGALERGELEGRHAGGDGGGAVAPAVQRALAHDPPQHAAAVAERPQVADAMDALGLEARDLDDLQPRREHADVHHRL